MLAATTSILQVIDLSLLVAGVLSAAGLLVWLLRRGRWRDPLADAPVPRGGPGATELLFVAAGYILIHLLTQAALVSDLPRDETPAPGSAAWHRLHLAGLIANALLIAPLAVLRRQTSRADVGPCVAPGRAALAALAALLAMLPIMTVQFNMGEVLWAWRNPDQPPPTHEVLDTLQTAGDAWAVVPLFVGAILITPVIEELLFRGVLLGVLAYYTRSKWAAIIAAAVAFGVVHGQPQDILPLFTMAVFLGALRVWSGRLWPCILVHVLFNARTMIFMALAEPAAHPI